MNASRRSLERPVVVLAMTASLVASLGQPLTAQGVEQYTARLGWVPTGGGSGRITGRGMATATLSGRSLTIQGSFEALGTPASLARLHQGIAKGARGAAIADLTITKNTTGSLSGSVTLTPDQVGSLKQGRLYLQVHSEKGVAPDGANLWGWFLR
jgi:hypothetical protein